MSRQARPKRPILRTHQFAASSRQTETTRIADLLSRSLMLVTALAPKIGYDAAAAIAKAARGEVRERIARLIIALGSATAEPSSQALAQVLAIGSSSGTEIAFGVIRGLASLIDNGEWDHGHQDRH